MARTTKEARVAHDQGLITGINKRLATATLLIDGQVCNAAALTAPLTQRVTTGNAVLAQRAAVAAATKTDDTTVASTAVFVAATVEAVYAAFGNDAVGVAVIRHDRGNTAILQREFPDLR